VTAGETVAIVESMKMELVCPAPVAGKIEALLAQEGQPLTQGQNILALKPSP
jgi:biotin carboxyl carrier protein